jgi:hypothetical protein
MRLDDKIITRARLASKLSNGLELGDRTKIALLIGVSNTNVTRALTLREGYDATFAAIAAIYGYEPGNTYGVFRKRMPIAA